MVPTLNKVYSDYKENKAGLIVISIFGEATETDAQAKEWDTKYNVKYPAIGPSKTSGGAKIYGQYGLGQFPQLMLIKPAKSAPFKIVEENIWPPGDLQKILNKYSISKSVTGIQLEDFTVRSPNLKVNGYTNNTLSFYVPHDGNYSLSLFAMNGVLVRAISNAYFASGNTSISLFDKAEKAQGSYIFTFENEEKSVSGKVMVK